MLATPAGAWVHGGVDALGAPRFAFGSNPDAPHEAGLLRLDSTKARLRLGWRPRLSIDDALRLSADWYRANAAGADMRALTLAQISEYEARMAPEPTTTGA